MLQLEAGPFNRASEFNQVVDDALEMMQRVRQLSSSISTTMLLRFNLDQRAAQCLCFLEMVLWMLGIYPAAHCFSVGASVLCIRRCAIMVIISCSSAQQQMVL